MSKNKKNQLENPLAGISSGDVIEL